MIKTTASVAVVLVCGWSYAYAGSLSALADFGTAGDGQTTFIYNPTTGEVQIDAPAGTNLTSVNIVSASGVFTGDDASNLGGSFDIDTDTTIFKATFGSSFGSLSFGNVAPTGIRPGFFLSDITITGSLEGGGGLGNVDCLCLPEPSTSMLAWTALLVCSCATRRRVSIRHAAGFQ